MSTMASPREHPRYYAQLFHAWNIGAGSKQNGPIEGRTRARAILDHIDPYVGCEWCQDLATVEAMSAEASRKVLRETRQGIAIPPLTELDQAV